MVVSAVRSFVKSRKSLGSPAIVEGEVALAKENTGRPIVTSISRYIEQCVL